MRPRISGVISTVSARIMKPILHPITPIIQKRPVAPKSEDGERRGPVTDLASPLTSR
jgi:hypothetical protein